MRIVLDTNVLVSGLLSPEGSPAKVLALVAAGHVGLLADDRILAEYERVLRRRKFALDPRAVAEFMRGLEALAETVPPLPSPAVLPDPGDVKFLECALAGAADCIVTGNRRHFPRRACLGVRVLSPAAFVSVVVGATGGK